MSVGRPPMPGSPQVTLAILIDGYLATQLLYVAVKCEIPEHLADGPLPAGEIAGRTGIAPMLAPRLLGGLVALGVLACDADERFALTDMGTLLLKGSQDSMRGAVLARGDIYYRAGGELLASITGGVPFELAYGEPFFDYLSRYQNLAASFQASMGDRSRREAAAVVDAVDFDGFTTVVDVGGGSGVLLEAVLGANPHLQGTLFDLPGVVSLARERLAATGVAERCQCVAGDFFTSGLPAGDLHLLSRVLHDWDDASAVAILQRCREAMESNGCLRIVEAVLPDRPGQNAAVTMMDLHMLLLFRDAHERTVAGYETLLARAGLRLERVVSTGHPTGIAVIEAVPA
jgi:hypothetical protein